MAAARKMSQPSYRSFFMKSGRKNEKQIKGFKSIKSQAKKLSE